jgi:hypothetical protein
MAENIPNDNLERFFKANLERYSPEPSADFWSKMESAIPPRPSLWLRWRGAAARWAGLGFGLLLLTTAALLWRNDRLELAQLNRTVSAQQQTRRWAKRLNGTQPSQCPKLTESRRRKWQQLRKPRKLQYLRKRELHPFLPLKTRGIGRPHLLKRLRQMPV